MNTSSVILPVMLVKSMYKEFDLLVSHSQIPAGCLVTETSTLVVLFVALFYMHVDL